MIIAHVPGQRSSVELGAFYKITQNAFTTAAQGAGTPVAVIVPQGDARTGSSWAAPEIATQQPTATPQTVGPGTEAPASGLPAWAPKLALATVAGFAAWYFLLRRR
jgi:hypothetical protein